MKKSIIIGSVIIVLGLLIALGPQFLFKVCNPNMVSSENTEDCCTEPAPEASDCCGTVVSSLPICHWSARAELGMGFFIAALGACMIVFTDLKTLLGLSIGIFLADIIVLAIPHGLIGGCDMMSMACRKTAFPALTIEGVILLIFAASVMVYSELKSRLPQKP